MKSPAPKGSGSMRQPATVPAKRKPGQPPRAVRRRRTLPRVSEATHAIFSAYATVHDCYLADAVEAAAEKLAEASRLRAAIAETLADHAHLADGEVCTLIKLKRALQSGRPAVSATRTPAL